MKLTRKRLQVAASAEGIWQLHTVYVRMRRWAENGVGCYFQGAARGISRRRGFVCAVAGQYLCESPSRRHGRA